MRALAVGVPALLLALMVGAKANVAQSDPWCARSATGCGFASSEQCTMTATAESGRCEKNAIRKPRADQPLIAQQESAPAPPEAPDRKQSAMPQATRQQKMQTCEFGAKDQKLAGAPRKTFMAKCLASDDAPVRKTSAKPKKQP
jgi:psiF repeat